MGQRCGGDPLDALWSENQTVEVANGIYDVELGILSGLPADLHTHDDLFLQVDILHPIQGMQRLSPLMPVNSTMFALKAAHADDAGTLEDLGATDFSPAVHEHDSAYVNTGEVDSITSAMVADSAIGSVDLASHSVGATELADNAVDTSAIATSAVTNAKIYPNAVDSGKIADGTVTSGDLADGAAIVEISDDDGSGSGLDADLLDNHDSAYFATSSHLHDSRYVNTTGDTLTGALIVEGALSVGIDAGGDNDYLYMDSGTAEWLRWDNAQTRFQLSDALNVSGGSLAIGTHSTQPAYNSIGAGTPATSNMNSINDLYVQDDIEVRDSINAHDIHGNWKLDIQRAEHGYSIV